jgi:hypothetical protein
MLKDCNQTTRGRAEAEAIMKDIRRKDGSYDVEMK